MKVMKASECDLKSFASFSVFAARVRQRSATESAVVRKEGDSSSSIPLEVDSSGRSGYNVLPSSMVNAAYSGNQNSITIPGGILKFPFFSAERPFSINFGFIGVVIGHEFTHGLDDKGSKFDQFGNLRNWFGEDGLKRFRNRSECFVQQYGTQVEPLTGLNLNGRNTLGENIGDNGGLREAWNAFQTRQKLTGGVSPRLADLPQYSPEQLFFISYANTWCQRIRPEALKRQIEYDPHSPGQYRVNIPLSNSESFAKAFHCAPGTKMNPPNKCQLW